ncbi:MAG: hypothetical protein LBD07_02700 [Spirochaetaceae bacterium]|jgi:hypothetical protein|nr:hypothetical protein [Spirochaetaceae bacterium]
MSKITDWLPHSRAGHLVMAKEWMAVLGGKISTWNIPSDVISDINALTQAAESAMGTAQTESTRTPVTTARCRAAFEALTIKMRDVKRRYFLEPPLTDADLISLGLKPHDSTHTPSGTPSAQAAVETFLTGRHELGIKLHYISGDPDDSANKGFRVWYSAIAHNETPPESPDDLRQSVFTKRRKDIITFNFDDSAKTAYIAVQIENDGKKGPWGPMESAVIP